MRTAILVVALLVAAWLVWWSRGDAAPPIRPTSPAAPATAPPEAPVPVTTTEPESAPVEREVAEVTPAARAPRRAPPPQQVVSGRVLFDTRAPAAGARVQVRDRATTAGADGAFSLELDSADDDLAAWLAGYEPVIVTDVGMLPDVVAGRAIDVTLPGKPLTIDGVLVNADGTPGKGWHVHLHGGITIVDDSKVPAVSAEDLAHGNRNRHLLGADGAFAFGGLRRDRDYVLRAWNPKTLQTALSPPLRAGTRGYRFVVPPGSYREQVRGRAIDRHGGGIAGVQVRVTLRLQHGPSGVSYETGQQVETDRNGAFTLVHVIREDLVLCFDGHAVMSTQHELPANDAGNDVLVRLALLCRFRCEADASATVPTSLRVLDAQQQPLRVTRLLGPGRTTHGKRLEWSEGDAALEMFVSDEATWLVFEVDEREVRRVPMRLTRDGVTVVRG